MMLTYDLKEKCHRVEMLVMPSYDQMNIQDNSSFKIVTLPYKLDLNLAPGSLQDILITGHYHQKTFENKKEVDDTLILQYFDSIVQVDLSINEVEQSIKLLHYLNNELYLYKTSTKLKILKADISQLLLRDLNQTLLNSQKSLINEARVRYYFFLEQKLFQDEGIQSQSIFLLEVSNKDKFVLKKQVIYQISSSPEMKLSEVLQYAITQDEADELNLLILNRQFVVQKFMIVAKSNEVKLILVDKSIKNDEAEKIWSDLLLKDKQLQLPDMALNFQNLNPREIILTENGIYLEHQFFQIIFEKNQKAKSMIKFESIRDKNVSTIFSDNQLKQYHVGLNFLGALQSPDLSSLLIYFRRYQPNENILAKREQRLTKRKIQSRQSKHTQQFNSNTNKMGEDFQSQREEDSRGAYFFTFPVSTSKVKQIMPLDNLSKNQVEYSTFLGAENDDILVKLKKRDSLCFLIFSAEGTLRQIQESEPFKVQKRVLAEYTVQQFFLCTKKKKTLIEMFKDKDEQDKENEKKEDKKVINSNNEKLVMKVLLISQSEDKFQILNFFRREKSYEIGIEFQESENIYSDQKNQEEPTIKVLKLQQNSADDGKAHLIKFLFGNKYFEEGQSSKKKKNRKFNFNLLHLSIDNYEIQISEDNFIFTAIKQSIDNNTEFSEQIKQRLIENNAQTNQVIASPKLKKNLDSESLIIQKPQEQLMHELFFKQHDFDIFFLPQIRENSIKRDLKKATIKINKYFLVFRVQSKFYYKDVEIKQEPEKQTTISFSNEPIKVINIDFREPGFVTQVLEVQQLNQLQIIYCEIQTGNFILIHWDLKRNEEISMQLLETSKKNPFYQVFKGADMQQNFLIYIGSDQIQDLRLQMPQNFLSGKQAWKGFNSMVYHPSLDLKKRDAQKRELFKHYQTYRDEYKVSYSCSKSLGLKTYGQTQLQRSYSYLDLQYLQYVFESFLAPKVSTENQRQSLILKHLGVQLPYNSNLMHFLATNQAFLNLYLQEIILATQRNSESYQKENILAFAYYGMFPNYFPVMQTRLKGRRPFTIALKDKNIFCLETIIKMLMTDKQMCYIRDIKQNLIQLLEFVNQSQTIHEFIQSHSLKQFSYWHEDEQNFSFNSKGNSICCSSDNQQQFRVFATQYLNKKDFSQIFEDNEKQTRKCCSKRTSDIKQLQKSFKLFQPQYKEVVEEASKSKVNETLSDEEIDQRMLQNVLGNKIQERHQIAYFTYDFEGLLLGKRAEKFLRFVVQQQPNEHQSKVKIFDLKFIQMLIAFQWNQVSRRYYVKKYSINFKHVLVLGYILYLQYLINCPNESEDLSYECSQTIVNKVSNSYWDSMDVYILFPLIILIMVNLFFELEFMVRTFNNIQNILIISINFLYLIKLLSDQYLLAEFRLRYIDNNLQAYALQDDYWQVSDDEKHFPVFKEYLFRYSITNIFIIKYGNALLLIIIPLLMLYNGRFDSFMITYISRFFFVLRQLDKFMLLFILIGISLLYSYNIISVLNYDTPIDLSGTQIKTQNESIIPYVGWVGFLNTIFKKAFEGGIIAIIVLIVLYTGIAMTQEDVMAGKTKIAQRIVDHAEIIYEGNLTMLSQSKFRQARYVIEFTPHNDSRLMEDRQKETDDQILDSFQK